MSRRRESTKRLNRTQWFAAYRATRDRLTYGAAAVEVVYLTRHGKTRPVRVEFRPYSAKYGGDSERLHIFELKFADGDTK